MKRDLLFLDTETDGLGWDRRMWEIGMISVEYGAAGECIAVDESVLHIADFRPDENSDTEALRIGRFSDRWRVDPGDVSYYWAESLAEAMATIDDFSRDAQIIGSAPWFDTHIIEREMQGRDRIVSSRTYATEPMTPRWYHRLRDIGSVATGYFREEVGGLDDVARRLGIEVDESMRHTAIGDCRLTLACWEAMMGPVR